MQIIYYSKSCLYISDESVKWSQAFKNCDQDFGRLFAPRYFSEWQGIIPSHETFWTGLILNELGLVYSSHGESMTKIKQIQNPDLFLPEQTVIHNQILSQIGPLVANLTHFVANDQSNHKYICEYRGNFQYTTIFKYVKVCIL